MKTLVEELNAQNEKDIKEVMQTSAGRRVFSYILMNCNYLSASMKGNSRDFFEQGRRSVAIDLIGNVDALGIEGVMLRQKAELEYIQLQESIKSALTKEAQNAAKKGVFTQDYFPEHKDRN